MTPSATATHSPSGQPMPVGDVPGWRQIFKDDFTSDVPLGQFPAAQPWKWSAYDEGWRDTSRNGTYSPARVVSVKNSIMDLYVRTEQNVHLVAAPLPRIYGPGTQGGLIYGRYAVRFRADPTPGFKMAWLLWPDSEKWTDGEIDFPEGELTGEIEAFLHHKGAPTTQEAFKSGSGFNEWHTAVIEWTPTEVRFLLDGKLLGVVTDRNIIPDHPMHWVLQTETALDGRRPASQAKGHIQIDWITAYSLEIPSNF
ncbi:glycoside hydrolase family 16 protein [Winogradskya humida]|nr:glycoside hydrolase family 16 protein [Actinoplanes humidus]